MPGHGSLLWGAFPGPSDPKSPCLLLVCVRAGRWHKSLSSKANSPAPRSSQHGFFQNGARVFNQEIKQLGTLRGASGRAAWQGGGDFCWVKEDV